MRTSGWRGCSNVGMTDHGSWSDPDLNIKCDGEVYTFNYWEVENELWDEFLVSEGITESGTYIDGEVSPEWEEKFSKFCQTNAYNYMVNLICEGYFADDSFDWHDNY